MQVLFVNNEGGGFADYVTVDSRCTVQNFFDQEMDGSPADYHIRVNREIAMPTQRLSEGDKVTIIPKKIQGAR